MKTKRGGWSWGPVETAKLRILSVGAGVQSTALALMAINGEVGPLPDVMIFADPGAETGATMDHLAWLEAEVTKRTNGRMQTLRVSNGSITETIERRANGTVALRRDGQPSRFVSAPFFTENGGMGRRQCTREFKIEPITKMQRQMLGFKPRQRIPVGACEVWIGISTDEVTRASSATESWCVHRYPLLEQRMSRHDCEAWLQRNGYPVPPKSACVFCPYRSNLEWRWLKENDPAAWAEAVRIDELIRQSPNMTHREYLHRDRMPLSEVDLRTDSQRNGQHSWLLECEGGCGL